MIEVKLETERIRLVKPCDELVPAVRAALLESRRELEEYLPWVQESLDDLDTNMQIAIQNYEAGSNELRYYIVERDSSEVVGAIGLMIRDMKVPFFEIGYWVRSSKTGCGFITEAVRLVEHFAMEELGARRLEIRLASGNLKSKGVAQRCGYVLEAELCNERCLPSGELVNTSVFAKCK